MTTSSWVLSRRPQLSVSSRNYESRYKAAIPAATLVADKVRDEILNEAPGLGVTEFYNLENDEYFLLIQKAIKPRNALEFAKRLSTTATIPSG
jgi:hypothetical protein